MRRHSPALTLALAAALTLSACGGDGGPGPTAGTGGDSVSNSSTPTPGGGKDSTPGGSSTSSPRSTSGSTTSSDADSDEPTLSNSTKSSSTSSSTSTDTGAPFDAAEFTDRLEAAVDANPTVKIDVTAKIAGQSQASATGVQDLSADSLDMDVSLAGQQLGYRLVDGQYYLAQPPKWVKVDEGSTNPLVKTTIDQVQILSMRRQLDAFVAGVEKAGNKGTEDVGGVSTTHYTATVDTATSLRELGMKPAPGAPETVIYDVWLDEDDLIRRMEFTLNGATARLLASEWGEPVSITAPSGSELAKTP
ncbi:LppX_LprAFG lipoprotein [Janibacter sp. G349]|uniref:LppX_LprAFG lipoprotein n=1 Tax=unclassified Janibacter TaxID=2649294 RepID=UPI003B75E84A